MFGESESESPRVPSPWDSLISISPTPAPTLNEYTPHASNTTNTTITPPQLPKLVPEAEEGNVEYKLQLLSPSPSRFARLVTQLKWRLLEGGGQAFYELGVADSGVLVGLPRAALEESLETLEMMAGEIGASVIVVKEVEIPAGMHAGSGKGSETDIDRWNTKRQMKSSRTNDHEHEDGATTTDHETEAEAETETETEPEISSSSTDVDADDETDHHHRPIPFHLRFSSISNKSTLGSNPKTTSFVTFPSDSTATSDLFELESEDVDSEPDHQHHQQFSIDLEIASVFKPRPIRTRATPSGPLPLPQKVKRERGGGKKERFLHLPHRDTVPVVDNNHTHTIATQPKSPKLNRRQTRDRRRDEKRKALMAYAQAAPVSVNVSHEDARVPPVSVPVSVSPSESSPHPSPPPSDGDNDDNDDDLDVFASPTQMTGFGFPTFPFIPNSNTTSHLPDVSLNVNDISTNSGATCDAANSDTTSDVIANSATTSTSTSPNPNSNPNPNPKRPAPGTRLIVEALVVRKMSLEEGFLDFGGFSWM